VDARTLRVREDGGFMPLPSERLFHNTRVHPFHAGDLIRLEELEVTITQVTSDGRPAEILARFEKPLEDPQYLWYAWQGAGYAPFVVPGAGASQTMEPADFVAVSYGADSPVTKAIRGAPTAVAAGTK
jgi:hypothetical protein